MDKKSEILKTLLEKNPNMDPAEVMQKLNMSSKSNKTIKQKLLDNVFTGGLMTLMGLAILIPHLCGLTIFGNKENGLYAGGMMLAMGVAFFIYYFVSKKQLSTEIEAEEKRLQSTADDCNRLQSQSRSVGNKRFVVAEKRAAW